MPESPLLTSHGARPTRRTPFVGRQRELLLLVEGLERARAGEGSIVLLAGEPGIGKTRAAEELAAAAVASGTTVLWGRCLESEGLRPSGPDRCAAWRRSRGVG